MMNILKISFTIAFIALRSLQVYCNTVPELVSPAVLLEKIARCPEITDYTGTFVLEFTGEQKPYSIINHMMHRHPDITRLVCLAPPERAGRIVYIHNSDIYMKKKATDSLFHKRSESMSQRFLVEKENIDLILKNYLVSIIKDSLYCKNPISLIKIVPLDSTRPDFIVYVDKKSGLILKLEKFRNHNKIFGFNFTEVNFSPSFSGESIQLPSDDVIKKEVLYEIYSNEEELVKAFGQNLILPSYLPAGFKMRQYRLIKHADETTAHIVYTDGVTNLSFFIRLLKESEKQKTSEKEYVIQGRDDVNMIRGRKEKFRVSCIGDLNREVLVKVFESVK